MIKSLGQRLKVVSLLLSLRKWLRLKHILKKGRDSPTQEPGGTLSAKALRQRAPGRLQEPPSFSVGYLCQREIGDFIKRG